MNFIPLSGRKSKSGNIHPSLFIHHLPSLSVLLPSVHGDLNLFTSTCSFPALHLPHPLSRSLFLPLQSVPGSKCVYVPLSACLYSDGNTPNVFLFQGILCLSYLLLNQREKFSCGHTQDTDTLPRLFRLSLTHKYKCVVNVACTHTHADGTTSDCSWTSG